MKRVAIFGSPGSGKSTLARHLAALTGLPAYHLDTFYFNPGWHIKPAEEFRAAIANLVITDYWITDGNFLSESYLTGRIERADTFILLERPRWLCLWRVIRRTVFHFGRVRPDQAAGCPERLDWEFLKFVWNYPAKTERIRQMLNGQTADKTVLILSGNREVGSFLAHIKSETPTLTANE